jgi:hypothetical protein
MAVVRVPKVSLWGRVDSIPGLVAALEGSWTIKDPVTLDFEPCDFLSAEAVAVLAGFVRFRRTRGQQTRLLPDTLRSEVRKNLWKMGLLELFGERPCPAPGNSLPLYQQQTYDREAIVRYIEREVMSRAEMPLMSKNLRKEIRRSFAEIFGNVFNHSESLIGGLVCGQVYPKRKEIQLTFFDSGTGIGRNVRSCVKGVADDPTAIRWALERGTSTLALSQGHPRGLGLYLLRQFLRLNGGELQVYANSGYYREQGTEHQAIVFSPSLEGTLIDLRIRIEEGISYRLAEEGEEP